MMREYQVRICERLGVQFPGPTRQPVLQSVKFEFIINLKTAKTLGINIPASFLSLADELID
jgi:hypothetical protein